MCGHRGVTTRQAFAAAGQVELSYWTNTGGSTLLPHPTPTVVLCWANTLALTHADNLLIPAKLEGASSQNTEKIWKKRNPQSWLQNNRKRSSILIWFQHVEVSQSLCHKVTLWNMATAVKDGRAMCSNGSESIRVCVCASSHYLLLPSPGDSAPSLHLSSWLATICRSTSSSLVSRSNWSSCK